MDPEYLTHLVMVGVNKKSNKPSTTNVKDKYYELSRGQGGKELERNEDMEVGLVSSSCVDAALGSWARCAAVGGET